MERNKMIMTITYAVWGCGELDAMEIAIVFLVVLHDSHINEEPSNMRNLTSHRKSGAWCNQFNFNYGRLLSRNASNKKEASQVMGKLKIWPWVMQYLPCIRATI